MKIDKVSPSDPQVRKIVQGLNAANQESGIGPFETEQFAFIAQGQDGEFLGGAKGKVFAGWLHLSWLYSTRAVKGTGSALMRKVEEYAKENGCRGVMLDTFEFQAPDFYKKLGYQVFGQIPDFIDGNSRRFLYKRF